MNDIITSIIDYIDSHLTYKFKRGQSPHYMRQGNQAVDFEFFDLEMLGRFQCLPNGLQKIFRDAFTNNAIESIDLCGQLFCFIMQGDDIIVHTGDLRGRELSWQQYFSPIEVIECYKFNICDNAKNGIDIITAMLMLQELKHLPHDKEDLVLGRLLDCICIADKRFERDNDVLRIKSVGMSLRFKPKMVYPRYNNTGKRSNTIRLLCIEYYQEHSNNRFSVSYNFDDIRFFKRLIKWLAKDKFSNCISNHISSQIADHTKI